MWHWQCIALSWLFVKCIIVCPFISFVVLLSYWQNILLENTDGERYNISIDAQSAKRLTEGGNEKKVWIDTNTSVFRSSLKLKKSSLSLLHLIHNLIHAREPYSHWSIYHLVPDAVFAVYQVHASILSPARKYACALWINCGTITGVVRTCEHRSTYEHMKRWLHTKMLIFFLMLS